MQKITNPEISEKLKTTDGVIYNFTSTRVLLTTKPQNINTIPLAQKATLTTKQDFLAINQNLFEPEQKKLFEVFADEKSGLKIWKFRDENFMIVPTFPTDKKLQVFAYVILTDMEDVSSSNKDLCVVGECKEPAKVVLDGISLDNLSLFYYGLNCEKIEAFVKENFDIEKFAIKAQLTLYKENLKNLNLIIQNFLPLCEQVKNYLQGSEKLKITSLRARVAQANDEFLNKYKNVSLTQEQINSYKEKIKADITSDVIDKVADMLLLPSQVVRCFIENDYVNDFLTLDSTNTALVQAWQKDKIEGIANVGGLKSEVATLTTLIKSFEQNLTDYSPEKIIQDLSDFTTVKNENSINALNANFLKNTVFYLGLAFDKDYTNIPENYKQKDAETQILPWKSFFGNRLEGGRLAIFWLPVMFIDDKKAINPNIGFHKKTAPTESLKMITYSSESWINDILFFAVKEGKSCPKNNETLQYLLKKWIALIYKKNYNEDLKSFANLEEESQAEDIIERQFSSKDDMTTKIKPSYNTSDFANSKPMGRAGLHSGMREPQKNIGEIFLDNFPKRENHIFISLSDTEFGFQKMKKWFVDYQPQMAFLEDKIFQGKIIDFVALSKIAKPAQAHLFNNSLSVFQSWLSNFSSSQNITNSFHYSQKGGDLNLALDSNDDIIKKTLLIFPMIINALNTNEILIEDLLKKKLNPQWFK